MPKVASGAELLPGSDDSYGKIEVGPRTRGALYFDQDEIYNYNVYVQLDTINHSKNFPIRGIDVIRLSKSCVNGWTFENATPYTVVFTYFSARVMHRVV